MEYYQQEHHRITADFARRIGKIALQYGLVSKTIKEDFTVTLHLCLLQSLLTNCTELLKAMDWSEAPELGLHVPLIDKASWGIHAAKIVENTFEGTLTVAIFLTHLRHAMSHPTGTNVGTEFPSTGYNSIADHAGQICAIEFSNSPDTSRNHPKTWQSAATANSYLRRNKESSSTNIPNDVSVERTPSGKFGLFRGGELYAREFVVILTTAQIRTLLLGLSNLLAQPSDEEFNGKYIRQLVA